MRSPGSQVSLEEKLGLAEGLLAAGDSCAFPDRSQFLLDWVCNALRAKGSEGRAPPRTNPRVWKLLAQLLEPREGSGRGSHLNQPAGGASAAAQTSSATSLSAQLLGRLAQSSRMLLQAAASALAASAGAAGNVSDADASTSLLHLASPVGIALRSLLLVHFTWFRPGTEAIAEYAVQVAPFHSNQRSSGTSRRS